MTTAGEASGAQYNSPPPREAGKDAVRVYVAEQAAKGLAHARNLIAADRDSVVAAVDGLSEEEGARVTLEGEWTPAQVLAHLNRNLPRSLARLQALSSGREWLTPPPMGEMDSDRPIGELRHEYIDGMQAIIEALDQADETVGRDLRVDHADYGNFDWLEWALYSHHVHTSDHIGQLREARARLRGATTQ